MERNLDVERLYFLGDYKNIKFGNQLVNIPEKVAMNDKAVELLFLHQFLSCEIAYRRYVEMLDKISQEYSIVKNGKNIADPEAVMEFLQTERAQTFAQLYEEIKQTQEPQEKETENV